MFGMNIIKSGKALVKLQELKDYRESREFKVNVVCREHQARLVQQVCKEKEASKGYKVNVDCKVNEV